MFADLDDDQRWEKLHDTLAPLLLSQAHQAVKAPEWVRVRGIRDARPETDLGGGFGYNAVRVPLYAVRDGMRDDPQIRRVVEQVTTPAGEIQILNEDGSVKETLADPGYVAVSRLSRCAILNQPNGAIPGFEPTDYYPSVLHLLSISAARVKAPECIVRGS